jgi:hypothetical protein
MRKNKPNKIALKLKNKEKMRFFKFTKFTKTSNSRKGKKTIKKFDFQ